MRDHILHLPDHTPVRIDHDMASDILDDNIMNSADVDDILIDGFLVFIIEILVIINAKNLGWDVEIKHGGIHGYSELVLTKPADAQTIMDRDTNALLRFLSAGLYSG